MRVVVLESLLEREGVEFTTECKLTVDFFLGDVEVLYVEEAYAALTGALARSIRQISPTFLTA